MSNEELLALQSVYCLPNEIEITGTQECREISVHLKTDNDGPAISITVTFHITKDYPDLLPQISLFSNDISRGQLSVLKKDIAEFCEKLLGNPMLLEIISYIQENMSALEMNSTKLNIERRCENCEDSWTMLLHLDHMRAKNRYVKTVEKLVSDFELGGRLLFQGKTILILLQGEHTKLKEYVSRHRSINIDVDSKGHSCKERMLSVLCEEKRCSDKKFSDFKVLDLENAEDVKQIFGDFELSHLYDLHIK